MADRVNPDKLPWLKERAQMFAGPYVATYAGKKGGDWPWCVYGGGRFNVTGSLHSKAQAEELARTMNGLAGG